MEKTSKWALWAIGDLHLSLDMDAGVAKPMDIFGDHWQNHADKIETNWRQKVSDEDVVLIPGDICWANRLEDAMPTLNWVASLPGRKIILKGNHDNWWQSIGKLRAALPKNMYALQHDVVVIDDVAFCGARGWAFYDLSGFGNQEKMLRREWLRCKESLSKIPETIETRIAMMHFPPFEEKCTSSIFTALLEAHGVQCCVFGHLHGKDIEGFSSCTFNQVKYMLVSADYLDFSPVSIYN